MEIIKTFNSGEIRNQYEERILNLTDEQLEIIQPSLKDFISKVISEQPDIIFFMDKGARIFGTPIKKFLDNLNLPKMPEIKFYNDDDLKGSYLDEDDKIPFDEIVNRDFSEIKDKKIFFFDETFSSGKGAATLKEAKNILNNENIFYFALTKDPLGRLKKWREEIKKGKLMMFYDIPLQHHEDVLRQIEEDEKFVIYENEISDLFSSKAASLYVDDIENDGKVETVHKGSKKQSILISKLAKSQNRNISMYHQYRNIPAKMRARLRNVTIK